MSRAAAKPAKAPPRPFRVCQHCSRDCGREGPRPAGSMLKLVAGEMQFACQASCWRALGWSAP